MGFRIYNGTGIKIKLYRLQDFSPVGVYPKGILSGANPYRVINSHSKLKVTLLPGERLHIPECRLNTMLHSFDIEPLPEGYDLYIVDKGYYHAALHLDVDVGKMCFPGNSYKKYKEDGTIELGYKCLIFPPKSHYTNNDNQTRTYS